MAELLRLENLFVGFPVQGKIAPAVNRLNFSMPKGSISCVVGESGCGKSLACRAVLRLLPERAKFDGQIFFQGENIAAIPIKQLRKIRGAAIGMIFQEPMTSLNPVLTVGEQTAEPLRLHLGLSKKKARNRVIELFQETGIPSAEDRYDDYPHQLSGGARQRVMIAMALACGPALLLADEPTTALDATVQGQILRLIYVQSRERGMGVLLITHDLGVVAEIADYVGVMYAGSLVERAPCREIFTNPLHPYTQGLMACAPGKASAGIQRLPSIPGFVPALGELPAGCAFAPRCSKKMPICSEKTPPKAIKIEHEVSCWLYAG